MVKLITLSPKLNVILLISVIWLCNCSKKESYTKVSYTNREKDINEARIVAEKFYECLKNKKFEEALGICHEDHFKTTSKKQTLTFYKDVQDKWGDLISYKFEEGRSYVVNDTSSNGEYILIYNVSYTTKVTPERISLVMKNGIIKILGYRILNKKK